MSVVCIDMKRLFLGVFLLVASFVKGQENIDWDGVYQLQLSDFQSPATQVGGTDIYSLHTTAGVDFSFYMTNAEFMFTKNFNSRVGCSFKRNSAALVAPDSIIALDLLAFARFEFNLSELYARKFRKRLYEEKGAFSDVNFFKPVYDDIQREFSQRHTQAGKSCDVGRDRERLKELNLEVLKEIQELADFCKTCKPPKKKKAP